MQKINKACRAVLLTAMVFAAGAGMVQAAGGWEWTQGQGWVMGAGVSRPTAREQLHYAYELEQRGEFMDSARQYFLLIQNFPDSNEAGVGLQRLARCLFEMENYYTAYNAIEQVIKTYPGTGRMSDLVEIELRIAKKLMLSETPDLLSDNSAGSRVANVRRALEIIDSVISHDPFGPVAAEAYLVKGEGNLFINELATAREAFEVVQDQFPRSDFVERARLGVLRCDSLIGQARPQEVYEQVQVVREAEAERQRRGFAGDEEFDDVSESLRQLAEVEAAKMMDQAEQYRRMGTREAVQASEFLYKEIARRFPGTPQADDANDRLGNLRIPREQGRIVKSLRQIKLNPFTWNKDPEPPWIVPQLDPEDMVMLDPGLGPIAGVPETGVPATAGAPGVRPAALDSNAAVNLDMD
ncbi:MAG: tetratricopeptide repeat protein, partial [Planctomycetes bacterium]|nr:tetratricopeptide repeat protein [Planctomycetota bacterium]